MCLRAQLPDPPNPFVASSVAEEAHGCRVPGDSVDALRVPRAHLIVDVLPDDDIGPVRAVDVSQIVHVGAADDGAGEVGVLEDRAGQVALPEVRVREVGAGEVRVRQVGSEVGDVGAAEM